MLEWKEEKIRTRACKVFYRLFFACRGGIEPTTATHNKKSWSSAREPRHSSGPPQTAKWQQFKQKEREPPIWMEFGPEITAFYFDFA